MPKLDLSDYKAREVILALADTTAGKTYSVVKLLERLEAEGHRMVVMDKDNRFADMLMAVMGRAPDNLEYWTIETWTDVETAVREACDDSLGLGPGDWFVAEMMGSMWDFAQDEFTRMVHGETLAEYILAARIDAQKAADVAEKKGKDGSKEVMKGMAYNSLSGRLDWPAIKKMHNNDFRDYLITHGRFNILFTTEAQAVSQDERDSGRFKNFHQLGYRPDGEKENIFRVDTIMFLYRDKGEFYWRTDLNAQQGKDKPTRKLLKGGLATKVGAFCSYLDMVAAGKLAIEDDDDDEDI